MSALFLAPAPAAAPAVAASAAPATSAAPAAAASAAPATTAAAPLHLPRLLGPAAWARLPRAVQRRFAPGHGDAVYRGRMTLHCSPIGRVYALLSALFGSPLVGGRGGEVPATVNVRQDGRGGVVWERLLGDTAGAAPTLVRSTKLLDARGRLLEQTDGGLAMWLRVSEQGGALVFESRRYELRLGAWRLPLPALLTPGRCRVTHTDLGQGRFRFDLAMTHPLWGCTVSQSGVFTDPDAAAAQP